MQPVYKPMLKSALSITWRFKYLWFFGLFATLFGNGSVFNLMFNNMNRVESQGAWLWNVKDYFRTAKFDLRWSNLSSVWQNFDTWGIVWAVVIIAVVLFLLWLSMSSQGALVYGIKQRLSNKNNVFSENLRQGASKFWSIFLLNILARIITIAILTVVSIPFLILFFKSPDNYLWHTILVVLAFVVWVPVALVLAFLVKYAVIYNVNENNGLGEAISNAWKLFIKNWIVSLELAFLLLIITLVTGFLFIVLTVFVSLPFVMLGMIANYLASSWFFWLVVALGILTFIAILFLYGAALNVFQATAWVVLFDKINLGPVYSKILRCATWLTSRNKEIKE